MPQIFRPSANTVARVVLVAILVGPFLMIGLAYAVMRSPYTTGQDVTLRQPIPFSHKHHVGDDGIDCRYCHTSVEQSAFAGLPPTTTCMTCHSQLFTNAQMLAPVRASLAQHKPIHWQRVHRLPNYVYFDHSVHIAKGIGCSTCHGAVDDDAADAPNRSPHHGLVSRLPSQSGAEPASAVGDLQPALDAAERPARRKQEAACPVSHRHRTPDGLLAMPPLKPQRQAGMPADIDRRAALKLLASGVALSLASCGKPLRRNRPLRRPARARGAGRAAAVRHHARSRRLRPRRHRDVDGGAADQGRRQSAPSGEPRGNRRLRRGRGDVALRSRPLQGCARREQCRDLGGVPKRVARADGKGSVAGRRRLAHPQRARHLADTRAPARRAAQAVSAGALVPLRTGNRRFRNGRRAACVRAPADGAAALCRGRGRAGARRRLAGRRPLADRQRARFCRSAQGHISAG